jgi:hypothetical protein
MQRNRKTRVRYQQDDEIIFRVERTVTPSGPGVQASSGAIHYRDSTAIPTAWIHDRRLSADARGLLMWIASYPDDQLPTFELLARGVDGPVLTRRALGELDRVGYLVRHEGGRFGIRDASLKVVA